MTIKTKLRLAALFPVIFGIFIVFTEMWTIQIVNDVLTREKIAGEILFYGSLAFLGKEIVLLIRDKVKLWFKRKRKQ